MLRRVLQKIPFISTRTANRLATQSAFYTENRTKVLLTYRHLLKLIPKIYPRTLQQAQKLNQIRWIYKQSKQLPTIEEVEGRTRLAEEIVREVKMGQYARLGDLVPHRFVKYTWSTSQFLAEGTPKKRKWWRGHIY